MTIVIDPIKSLPKRKSIIINQRNILNLNETTLTSLFTHFFILFQEFVDITSRSELDLQAAIAQIGPISIALDASHSSFQLYSSGVYDEPSCSSTQLDFAGIVVGYGTQGKNDYYIFKNIWGTSWGEQGYMLISRNKKNQCGVATMASYPIVA